MALTITPTPLRVSKFATKPILSTFMLRSSLEKVRPLDRLVLTISPSRTSTCRPLSRSSCSTISDMVVLPDPDRPVNHNVNPRSSFIYVPFDAPTDSSRSLHFPPSPAHMTIVGSLGESPSGSLSCSGGISRSPHPYESSNSLLGPSSVFGRTGFVRSPKRRMYFQRWVRTHRSGS